MSTRIKDLFGYPKVIIKCDSGSDMLTVSDTAINELRVTNGSYTIQAVRDHPKDSEYYWGKSHFRWIGLSDDYDPPLMFGYDPTHNHPDSAFFHLISVEEFFDFFNLQLTITEQEFSDAFCELFQGVANE